MSYLSSSDLSHLAGMDEHTIKEGIAALVWGWYMANKDDVIISKRILFFSLNLRVRDLKFIFETLFGPAPAGA